MFEPWNCALDHFSAVISDLILGYFFSQRIAWDLLQHCTYSGYSTPPALRALLIFLAIIGKFLNANEVVKESGYFSPSVLYQTDQKLILHIEKPLKTVR